VLGNKLPFNHLIRLENALSTSKIKSVIYKSILLAKYPVIEFILVSIYSSASQKYVVSYIYQLKFIVNFDLALSSKYVILYQPKSLLLGLKSVMAFLDTLSILLQLSIFIKSYSLPSL
jgi:hypothetical protein